MTRAALLGLASTTLGVGVASLMVANGVVSGGGRSVSYAELVKGQQLDLTIPARGEMPKIDPKDGIGIAGLLGLMVAGDTPLKPIAQYTVVGNSFERPGIRDIVAGKPIYSGDIAVPGMLHARMAPTRSNSASATRRTTLTWAC